MGITEVLDRLIGPTSKISGSHWYVTVTLTELVRL
jgi:hypothetical protein